MSISLALNALWLRYERLRTLAREFDFARPVCDSAPNPYDAPAENVLKEIHGIEKSHNCHAKEE